MITSNAGEQPRLSCTCTTKHRSHRKHCNCCDDLDSSSEASCESATDDDDSAMGAPSGVELHNYREVHLASNNIHLVSLVEPIPASQLGLAERICGPTGTSPDPTIGEVHAAICETTDCADPPWESRVERRFLDKFQKSESLGFKCCMRIQIHDRHVPHKPGTAQSPKISHPVPDLLYGYSGNKLSQDGTALDGPSLDHTIANGEKLMLPFLAVEAKGQWPASTGNLCVAENQAAGSSTACVKMMENLNDCLAQDPSTSDTKLDSTSFSIVTNGTEARLFMTWREGTDIFKLKHLRSYCLSDEDHYIRFHRAVHNILDWGYNERLNGIRSCIAILQARNDRQRRRQLEETGLETEDRQSKRQRLRK